MKKLIPNPEYKTALYEVSYRFKGKHPRMAMPPPTRTNNPRFLADGTPAKDVIPSHIEVDV